MRKLLLAVACFFSLVLCLQVGAAQAAETPIRLYLDNKKLNPEVPPRIVNDNTLVPVRIISEELGAKVSWNEREQKVTVERNGLVIQLFISKKEASVNGSVRQLEVAPVLDGGSTLLPVRFVSENLGVRVQWDELTQSVFLFDTGNSIPVDNGSDDDSPTVPAGATPTPKPGSTATPDRGSSETAKPSATPTPKPSSSAAATVKPSPGVSATPKPTDNGNSNDNGGTGSNSGSKQAEIKQIAWDKGVLRVIADGGDLKPKISRLADPERLIIDIPNAVLAKTVNGKPAVQNGEVLVQDTAVSKIRYALFQDNPAIVRIVVDLNQKIAYNLLESGSSKELALSLHSIKYRVVLDAGHGGKDPGAQTTKGHNEKDFNLSVVLKLAKILSADPLLDVQLTRQDDTFVELDDRASFANDLGADVFVSVHANKFTKETVAGTETYYSRDESQSFADVLHRHIVAATGFTDRNVRKNDLRVTKKTVMPAVLCEIGYLSNAAEEQALFSESLQNKAAAAIAAGIKEYLQIQ